MGIAIQTIAETGQTLYVTLQQVSNSGALGDHWNATTGAWAASVATVDRKIPMTEAPAGDKGLYTAGWGQLGTYSGIILVKIHDTNRNDEIVGSTNAILTTGNESRLASVDDVGAVPLATWAEINTQGGVLASNMRGTDNALLAASYVAPDNTGIGNAAADAALAKTNAANALVEATAAKTAAQSADGKLPADTTTKINRLDTTISSRSTHSASDVRLDINANGGVIASNMRGTDNAFLAASWVAPNNAGITTAATDATASKVAAQSVDAKLTALRAGYLDNLSAGPVATQAAVLAISNSTRSKLVVPGEVQIPDSGSTSVLICLILLDSSGNLSNADATPVFTATTSTGLDRTANLGAVTNVATGQYEVTYTISSAHLAELVNIKAEWDEQTLPYVDVASMVVSDTITGGGFTSTDRTQLTAVYNKLPSKSYLTGTALSDGDIDLAEMVGSRDPFKADVSALATSAAIVALEAHGDATWATATGFLATNDARLNNLDATISSRSTFNPGAPVALASDIADLQAHGDLFWDTAVGFLTAADARLNNLDATISSRSTFDEATDGVTLAAGHGLALEATAQSIKAKTDLIPPFPAAVGDIPAAGVIASTVEATLSLAHGAGAWTQSGGDATIAKQDQILAQIASMTPTPVSPLSVGPSRTWTLQSTGEGPVAQNLITISTANTVTLAMNFKRELNAGSSITTVVSATVIEGAAMTFTSLLPSGDRQSAHMNASGATAGLRRIEVKVNTSDGQVLIGRGYVEVV
jgi:hypothetical protein